MHRSSAAKRRAEGVGLTVHEMNEEPHALLEAILNTSNFFVGKIQRRMVRVTNVADNYAAITNAPYMNNRIAFYMASLLAFRACSLRALSKSAVLESFPWTALPSLLSWEYSPWIAVPGFLSLIARLETCP